MPSPLAHGSILLLIRAFAVRNARLNQALAWRPAFFYVACLATLWIADVDFVIALITDHPAFVHGGATHSLFVGGLFGLGFAGLCRLRYGRMLAFPSTLGLGLAAAWSHVLMDLATWGGRGIMIFWPFSTERFLVPPLFFGVHRSEPNAWHLHATTLVTELLFAFLVWRFAQWLGRRPVA